MTFIDRDTVKPGHPAVSSPPVSNSKKTLTARRENTTLTFSSFMQRLVATASWALSENARDAAIEAVGQASQASRALRYSWCILVMVAAGAEALTTHSTGHALMMTQAAMVLVTILFGLGPGALATLLSALCVGLLATPTHGPAGATVADAGTIPTVLFMGLGVSLLCGALQRGRQRMQAVARHALLDSERRFDALIEAVEDYAIFMLDPAGRILTWNTGAERIKRWAEHDITGEHFSLIFPAEAAQYGDPQRHLAAAAAHGCFREQAERVRKDGSRFWADVAIRAIRDEDGNLQGYAKVIRDITARVRAANDRLEDQRRITSIIESAMDAIITIDADQRIVLFNKAAEAMFQCSADEVLGQELTRFVPEHVRAAHAGHISTFAKTGVTSRGMGRIDSLSALRSNGEEFPIEASISQAHVEGSPLYTVILRDITQRKRAEERQSLLLLELAHRVKNTLAIVQSIVAQTRRFAPPEEFHQTLTGRLMALGAAHDLLTTSEWAGATLADVVRFAFAPHASADPADRWSIEGPGIWLASNEAVTLSLVFHELTTNAVKYGALSDRHGSILVCWALEPEINPVHLTIDWLERGGPAVESPSRRGFGSRLLEQAVSRELAGETILTFSPTGAECRLRLPLSLKVNVQ
jgi:PAS domain S-box-containing protein